MLAAQLVGSYLWLHFLKAVVDRETPIWFGDELLGPGFVLQLVQPDTPAMAAAQWLDFWF